MNVRQYENLGFRLKAKLSAWASSAKTFLHAPTLWRSADIHLVWQSQAQLAAQATLVDGPCAPGKKQKSIIIIPFRDKWDITSRCLESLENQNFDNHQITVVLVDNGSIEGETLSGIKSFLQKLHKNFAVRSLRYDVAFNFSILNNWAVRDCADLKPDIVFFVQ